MRLSHLFTVAATVFFLPIGVVAEESADAMNPAGSGPTAAIESDAPATVPEESVPGAEAETATGEPVARTADAGGEDLAWDQFDDPAFSPDAQTPDMGSEVGAEIDALEGMEADEVAPAAMTNESELTVTPLAEAGSPTVTESGVILGPKGVDDQGRTGRLHTVAPGNTLWDLSAAYLGTPWVWPSVWIDNDDIENPHLILPGDKIWITANEMRVVSDAEAESFLEPVVAEAPVAAPTDMDSDLMVDDGMPVAALDTVPDDPSSLDAFPVEVPDETAGGPQPGRQITVALREKMGFVSAETLAGASSIVESSSERTFLSGGDPVYLGVGEGDVEVGDQFTILREVGEVRDVETNRILGHHVEKLGWVEINELTGDTSIGEIRQAYDEIRRGDRVVPRMKVSRRVTVVSTPDAIEGQIVYLPDEQVVIADGGYVYLNRGEFHGIEIGSELEVFAGGATLNERERRIDVRTPDAPTATLIVVSVEPESCVAFVLNATRELEIGDRFRPMVSRMASR